MSKKIKFRESKQRQREKRQNCHWYMKAEQTFCHSKAVPGKKFCRVHASYMRKWIKRKHAETYSSANVVSWEGWSKHDT